MYVSNNNFYKRQKLNNNKMNLENIIHKLKEINLNLIVLYFYKYILFMYLFKKKRNKIEIIKIFRNNFSLKLLKYAKVK